MSRKDELLALADRVEALTGADREGDEAIANAIGHALLTWEVEGDRYTTAHRFTASLDAAMSLVPTEPFPNLRCGKWWWMLEVREWESVAHIAYENHDAGIPEYGATAATPALALTVAALRAIAATEQ